MEVELSKEDYALEVALEHRQEEEATLSESSDEEDPETGEFEEEGLNEVEGEEEVEVESSKRMDPPGVRRWRTTSSTYSTSGTTNSTIYETKGSTDIGAKEFGSGRDATRPS